MKQFASKFFFERIACRHWSPSSPGPGLGAIPIHNDYSMVPEPYPEFAMTGVGVWALEDWTVASGPTWISDASLMSVAQ